MQNPGQRLLDVALDALVPGIVGQCGGGITCATCHVKITGSWRDRLRPAPEDETTLLGYVAGADEDSRLACQLRLTDALDGLVATVAPDISDR